MNRHNIKRTLGSIISFIIFITPAHVAGYSDKTTHPQLTRRSSLFSNLNNYLVNNLLIKEGLNKMLRNNLTEESKSILQWLQQGSTDEDSPMCRASNHFHDPLKSWDISGMSDQPMFVNLFCANWIPWYSNITWATGYLSPPPDGTKAIFSTNPHFVPNTWDNAEDSYYNALTSTSIENQESFFADAFKALGQVVHLLQDVSVPAHVRNDFTSHLNYSGYLSSDPRNWIGNRYEHYVSIRPDIVATATPEFSDFKNPRLTDYWDTDLYNGDNPSINGSIGLAEFANANYLSDYTIPNNSPTTKHSYKYPIINNATTQICEDYIPGSVKKRKYISRNIKGSCPPLTEERAVDHFATASLLNREDSITNNNISLLRLWLDENVHHAYAKEILPKALGYSIGLLKYFFRGEFQVSALPIFYKNDIQYVRVKIKNMTPNETMENGNFVLTYRYTPTDGPLDGSKDKFGIAWYDADKTSAPCDKLEFGKDMTIDFIIDPTIPIDNYASIKFTLAYRGTLGNEKVNDDGTGGAVIGKVFTLGEIKFEEEWDNGLDGNCTWAHTDFNLFDQNPANGTTSNIIEGDSLVKENKRDVGYKTARVNESFVSTRYNNGEFKDKLPIKITPNTYIQFKIDEMWINQIPPAPPGYTNHWQGLMLRFNNGLGIQYSTQGQGLYLGPNVATFEFDPDLIIVDNIYQLFQTAEIPIPAGDMYLEEISFVQQLFPLDASSDTVHNQHMEVDFIYLVEEKEDEVIPQQ